MAKEFMDQGVASFQIADPMRGERAPTQDEVECHEATRPSALISPGLESNPDSCYDSDSSSVGSNCNGTADADEHDNISRTTSDTLAAERSETDTPKMDIVSAGRPAIISTDINPNSNTSIMGGDDDDVEPGGGKPPTQFASNVEYAAKVEFGLRLGYTEDQIFRALDKVGYKISEDELLAELIKISDLTERSDDSDDSVSDVNVGLDKFRIGDVDNDPEELRPIVVDGSNVAMSHGNNIVFSCAGIKLAVDWFRERGHKEITVFVPTWRKEASCYGTPITEQDILLDLEKDKVVVFTPARRVAGKRVICYDDRYIIKLAAENGGIVVSNDNYRDLIDENPDYKKVVDERLLMYSFVNDRFMPPDDPLGRYGPSLTDFLRKYPASSRCLPPACPYGKKCTYGNKCKYYHPERGQQPVKLINEKLIEKACKKIKEVKEKGHLGSAEKKTKRNVEKPVKKLPLTRTKSQTPAPQKKALTHTRSLQPNHSAVQSKPKSSSDFMQPESGGKFSKEVKDMVVKISVTTEFDSDNYHRYNNKLSELRQKVHDAEALGSSCQTPGEAVRRQDGDWMKDVVKEKRPLSSWAVPHKDLHPEFGDAQASFANGHLALAKKLSDEGNSGDNHRHNTGTHCLSPRKARLDVGPKLVQSQGQPPVRGHMTLQRQLSLKGSDDPRLSHGLGANYHGMSMVQAEENQQCPPSAQAGQSHWSRQGHNLLAKRASCPLVTVPARSRDCSPRPGVLSQCIPQHPQLTDCYINHVYDNNVTSSCDQNSLAAQQPMAEHLPLHRLKSDPLVPQNGARAHGLVNKFTEMSRQNSTSDPQLSSHQEEPDWCCSPDIAPGSDTNDLFMGIPRESVLGIPLHIRTAPNSPHIPMSPHLSQKSFPFKHSLGTLHLKDSHGSYPDVYASTSLAQVLQCSASNLQSGVSAQSIASYHMSKPLPSEVNGNSGFFLSGQSKPPQMMMSGLVQEHSKPSPVFSQPAYQPSTSQHIMTQIPPQMSTAVQQQQQHALIGANGPVPVIVRDCAVTQTMNLTRAPQSCARGVARDMFWPSSQADPCIGQTDARHKLYYHLCALFKEEQVKRVMSEHPNETNPQVLCKYLISR